MLRTISNFDVAKHIEDEMSKDADVKFKNGDSTPPLLYQTQLYDSAGTKAINPIVNSGSYIYC